jgi:Ca2+-binding RTX toxin-like protein
MATEPGASFYNTVGAVEALFNVHFGAAPHNTGLRNLIDIQDALDDLVSAGQLRSAPGAFKGSTEYTNVATGEKFFFIGPQSPNKTLNIGDDGNAIVDNFKSNAINAGVGNNTIQVADNAKHTVSTRDGDDTVALTGTGKTMVYTGTGNDTVMVVGNSNNTINTKRGDDKIILDSGHGNNTLTGGPGNDYFIIGAGKTGKDTITDFSKGDVLQIMDRNGDGKVTLGGDVLSIKQVGKDTVIMLQGGEKIVLKNVDHKHLHEDDDGTFHLS